MKASPRRGGHVKVRSLADMLVGARHAWETAHLPGAVLDAFRMCRQEHAPLPDWLGQAVDEAVTWWTREAPTGTRGRHSRPATARRDQVQDLEREAFYQMQLRRGLKPEEALAMAADWFRCVERSISYSLARAKRMTPEDRYLASDDRRQMWGPWRSKRELRRLAELQQQYTASHPPPPHMRRPSR